MSNDSKVKWAEFIRATVAAVAGAAITIATSAYTYGQTSGAEQKRLDYVETLANSTAKDLRSEHDAVLRMSKDVELLLVELRALRSTLEKKDR